MVLVKGEVRLPKGEVRTKLPMGRGQMDGTAAGELLVGPGKAGEFVRESQQGLGFGVHLEGPTDGDLRFRDRELADGGRFRKTAAAVSRLGRAHDEAHLALTVAGLGRLPFQSIQHRDPLGEDRSLGLILLVEDTKPAGEEQ